MANLTKQQIQQLVLDSITRLNEHREPELQLAVDAKAPIFGDHSPLDSLGLVTLTMDIEDALADQGIEVSLSDSRAMSRRQSPFRDVTSLVDFITEQMEVEG
ncbi:hypothetical protein SH139x_000184 [Planctomycetaceae bacterium SH139]